MDSIPWTVILIGNQITRSAVYLAATFWASVLPQFIHI